jgi:hypothetical protein
MRSRDAVDAGVHDAGGPLGTAFKPSQNPRERLSNPALTTGKPPSLRQVHRRLTPSDVDDICARHMNGKTITELARFYGVNQRRTTRPHTPVQATLGQRKTAKVEPRAILTAPYLPLGAG